MGATAEQRKAISLRLLEMRDGTKGERIDASRVLKFMRLYHANITDFFDNATDAQLREVLNVTRVGSN